MTGAWTIKIKDTILKKKEKLEMVAVHLPQLELNESLFYTFGLTFN